MTVLQPGDLLTAIRIPATWAGAAFYFEKVRERQVWDFPIVNVAAMLKVANGTIQDSRIVVNAVAAHPMRLKSVEDAVAGKPRNEETAKNGGRPGGAGRAAAGAQRIQDPADEKPGEAGHQGRGAGIAMNYLVQWGRDPWGEDILTHAQWSLVYVVLALGVCFMVGAHAVCAVLAEASGTGNTRRWTKRPPRESRRG